MPKFDERFFIALNDWQNGWGTNLERRNQIADMLKVECQNIDYKFKRTDKPCYRKRFLHSGELVDIIYNNEKYEGPVSWTIDYR